MNRAFCSFTAGETPSVLPSDTERQPKPFSTDSRLSRLRCLFVLLVFPALLATTAEAADDHLVCRVGFLQMVSSEPVSVNQCRQVAELAMAAWRFDLRQMKWNRSIDMERPLALRIISVERMTREHPGVVGFANGGSLVVVSTRVLTDTFANGTLAHELGHIQAFRAHGEGARAIPHYFSEGHGLSLGRLYRDHLGLTDHKYHVLGCAPRA